MAVFVPRDGGFLATELARGPWDPSAQHGGAPAALLMRSLEQLTSLQIARVTYEFLRPVPIAELFVDSAVARPGRRVQLLEASLRAQDGVEVARARALALQAADAEPSGDEASLVPGPAEGRENDREAPYRPMFAPDAIEIRFVRGTSHRPGPASAWFRMKVPLVAGEASSPLQRLAVAADFGNGISSTLPWDQYMFINPDLTVYVERVPAGEWMGLEALTRIAAEGVGTSESVLYDERGRVGRATQALLVAPR